jgi:hypothetical protein
MVVSSATKVILRIIWRYDRQIATQKPRKNPYTDHANIPDYAYNLVARLVKVSSVYVSVVKVQFFQSSHRYNF